MNNDFFQLEFFLKGYPDRLYLEFVVHSVEFFLLKNWHENNTKMFYLSESNVKLASKAGNCQIPFVFCNSTSMFFFVLFVCLLFLVCFEIQDGK